MNALAPPDQPGYARAHYWLARHILAAPRAASGAREAAESHLLRALDGELDDREAADALLGDLYLESRRYDEAESYLTRAVKAKPQLRLRLAQLYALRGDKDRACAEAQLAVSYFRARTQADLEDRRARLGWADAAAFLEDFPAAVTVLREGLNVSDEPAYRAALGGVYFLWSEAAARDPRAKPGDQLALVETGLSYDPANGGLLNSLLAAIKVGGPKADQAREALKNLLASGKATASAFRPRPGRLAARPSRRGAGPFRARQRAGASDAGHRQQPGLGAVHFRADGPAPRPGAKQPGRGVFAGRPLLPRHARPHPDEIGPLEGGPGRPGGGVGREPG